MFVIVINDKYCYIITVTTIVIKAAPKNSKLKEVSHSNHMEPNSQSMKHKLSNHF